MLETPAGAKILVVDDVPEVCKLLTRFLERDGHTVLVAADGNLGLELARKELPDATVLDYMLPDIKGPEMLKELRKVDAEMPILIVTAYAEVASAVEAVKLGAYDYCTKPFDPEDLIHRLGRALRERDMKRKLRGLYTWVEKDAPLREMMGTSNAVRHIVEQVEVVAGTDFTVVTIGETGTGKELVARAIHHNSRRRDGPFVPVDCGAIPETLIESELFGYEKGAFTGAERLKTGHFENADKGTLFLDEIGNLPLMTQTRFLRALQERCIRRVGGNEEVPVDIRVIVAGNRNLDRLVNDGKLRPDLYYRLSEFVIEVPPLRKRQEDIIFLCKRFLDAANLDLDKSVRGFSEDAVQRLLSYHWPGNVRELRNVIRRAALLADDIVHVNHLLLSGSVPQESPAGTPGRAEAFPEQAPDLEGGLNLKDYVREHVRQLEKRIISRTLAQTGGNKSKAARLLEVDYKTLHTKCKQYDL